MIPYNPSSFNTNKTILEQILELKNWLKDHPSYRVFMSTANGNDSMPDTYNLSDILDDADQLNVGDVVLFSNGCVGSVSSLDVDNQTFDCNLPCVSIKGPQGPRGYTGRGISNAQVDASGDLEITIFDPETSTSTTTNVGHVKGADGTNGTNGTDGAYVSSASVDASGDLQITIYDPATSTSSVVNAGHVVGADGQGIQIIDVTTTTGTLSASDLAKVTGTDDCTINYTSVNGTISFKRLFWDTSYAYFTGVYVDTDTYYCVTEVEIATGAFNIDINPIPIKDSNIDSGSATSGQVLTANGSGGASWTTLSSLPEIVTITGASGTLVGDNLTKIQSDNCIIYNTTDDRYYRKGSLSTGTYIYYYDTSYNNSSIAYANMIEIKKVGGQWTRKQGLIRFKPIASSIDSETATNGQVLTADGNGGASWQNASGGTFDHYVQITTEGSGTIALADIPKLQHEDSLLIWYDGGNYHYYTKYEETSSTISFNKTFRTNGVTQILINKSDGTYSRSYYKFRSSAIDSQTATNGQVLTADGNGGASWQNASGGTFDHYVQITTTSGTLSQTDYDKLIYEDSVIVYNNSGTYYYCQKQDKSGSVSMHFNNIRNIYNGAKLYRIQVDMSTRAFSVTESYVKISASNIYGTSTSGEVLVSNGDNTASWQTPSGSQLYQHNVTLYLDGSVVKYKLTLNIINSSNTAFTLTTLKDYLNNNGFNSNTKLLCVSGKFDYGSPLVNYVPVGIYYNVDIVLIASQTNATNSFTEYGLTTGYISDLVVAL